MKLLPRPYRDPNDLPALHAVLVAGRRAMDAGLRAFYVHPGDLNWWLFYLNQDQDPFGSLTLWEDASGQVVGWSLVSPHYRALDLFVLPALRGTPAAQAAWDWTEARLRERLAAQGQAAGPLRTMWVQADDEAFIRLLEARGYQLDPAYFIWGLERSLESELPTPRLPAGFALRPVAGLAEARPRALAAHAAFASRQPVEAYVEKYRRFMQSPAYAAALDLAAVPPTDEGIAAFAIAWTDSDNSLALLEPVGTHPAFQRQGLAQAVVQDALRRLQAAGLRRVMVGVECDNPAAQRLYQSVGFAPVRKIVTYVQPDLKGT